MCSNSYTHGKDNSTIHLSLPLVQQNIITTWLSSISCKQWTNILVVDDHKNNLDLLEQNLQESYWKIYTAHSGSKALESIKNAKLDLVLMDLAMPEMDGFETIKSVKKINAQLPVIACSAFTTTDFQDRAFDSGCESYITKPIDFEKLILQIQQTNLLFEIKNLLQFTS